MLQRLNLSLAMCCLICTVVSAGYEHYSEQKPLAIGSVRADREQVRTFQRLTLDIDLQATYDNAFDAKQISVDVAVTDPDGRQWTAPGFFYTPYRRDDGATKNRLTVSAGQPKWQARLSFAKAGEHRLLVIAKDCTGTGRSEPMSIRVVAADEAGMIRRHKSDARYFVTDRGETWFAVGANVCWGETWGNDGKHVFAYDDWFPRYASQAATTRGSGSRWSGTTWP